MQLIWCTLLLPLGYMHVGSMGRASRCCNTISGMNQCLGCWARSVLLCFQLWLVALWRLIFNYLIYVQHIFNQVIPATTHIKEDMLMVWHCGMWLSCSRMDAGQEFWFYSWFQVQLPRHHILLEQSTDTCSSLSYQTYLVAPARTVCWVISMQHMLLSGM